MRACWPLRKGCAARGARAHRGVPPPCLPGGMGHGTSSAALLIQQHVLRWCMQLDPAPGRAPLVACTHPCMLVWATCDATPCRFRAPRPEQLQANQGASKAGAAAPLPLGAQQAGTGSSQRPWRAPAPSCAQCSGLARRSLACHSTNSSKRCSRSTQRLPCSRSCRQKAGSRAGVWGAVLLLLLGGKRAWVGGGSTVPAVHGALCCAFAGQDTAGMHCTAAAAAPGRCTGFQHGVRRALQQHGRA